MDFPVDELVVADMALAGEENGDTNALIQSEAVSSESAIDFSSLAIGIAIGMAFCGVVALLVVLVKNKRGRVTFESDNVTSAPKESESTTSSLDMTEVKVKA